MELETRIQHQFPLHITQGALHTAHTFAHVAGPFEVYMHLLGEDTIDEVILSQQQYVSAVSCTPTPFGLERTYAEVRTKKKQIFGWCHSHGHLPNFFSAQDYENVLPFAGMGGITRTLDGKPIKLFYNVVVNALNDPPYATLAYHYEGRWDIIDPVPIHLIPGGKSISLEHARDQIARSIIPESPEQFTTYQRRPPKEQLLRTMCNKHTYYSRIIMAGYTYIHEPEKYSSDFSSILALLESKEPWSERIKQFETYYASTTVTSKEARVLQEIFAHNKSLKRKHKAILARLQEVISHATSATDTSLGQREATTSAKPQSGGSRKHRP